MEAITAELFRACTRQNLEYLKPIDGCFEQYGLDFMVDELAGLSEVNPG
jgi:hypothetical protein